MTWNNQPLIQLNLHQLLYKNSTDSISINHSTPPYTMITWSQTGDRCGIAIDQLPTLQDLSLSKAQGLPLHYRQSIGNMAKYFVIQSYQGIDLNILLLDLQQALNRTTHSMFSSDSALAKPHSL